ncbi:MAG: tRNA pseudouridine(55) synthase TruB [Xanthomonadales bacterium]|nr:tRNA pseudouridine(55) synthase TruB [Xanthomonadales bacterium]
MPRERSRSARIAWRRLNGILLLDKPSGASSNAVLQQVRRLFRAEKGGHTGSLDPLATGLLPICFGEATKIAGLLLGADKAYETECLLGVTTDSCDADGTVLERRPVPAFDEAALEAALATLRGRIGQVPPIYSALKRGGEPLYRIARRGEAVEVAPRAVDVARFECIARDADRLRLIVECGSGTYVRSLVRDLGERLGCGAHVTSLRRLWAAPFRSPRMYTPEQLGAVADAGGEAALDALLLPLESGLADHPRIALEREDASRLASGQVIAGRAEAAGRYLACGPEGRAVALAEVDRHGALRCLRGFVCD